MKIIQMAKGVFDRIIYFCAILSTISIGLIMLTNVLNTILRWLSIPIYGVFELNGLLVGINIFLGLAFVQKQKKHISVDMLSKNLPLLLKHIIAFVPYLIGSVFFAWVTYLYWGKAYDAFVSREVIQGIVHFPVFPLKAAMFLGMVLLTIQQIIDLITVVNEWLFKQTDKIGSTEMEVSGL